MNIINKGNFKILLLLISIIQILFTVFIYLLPEAGIPAPIIIMKMAESKELYFTLFGMIK